MREEAHVPRPLPQRRQVDGDDVDAVEELLPELALRDGVGQVAVGRRDDPHVHVHQRGAAHSPDLPLLQHAEQLHLEGGGQLGDLVEEERAPVGRLHQPGLGPHRAGERALLVTEELGLEEMLGQRRAVDRHERLARARAVGVDGARDQLLARAGLAEDQDVRLRPRRLLHQLEHLRHGGAAAHDVLEAQGLLELLAQVSVLDLEAPVPEGALGRDAKLIHREVLREVVERPLLDRGHRRLDGREPGDHDDGQRGIDLVGAPEERQPVHARHPEVGQHQVRPLSLEDRERGGPVSGRRARIALARQDAGAVLEHVGLIVDDQDAGRAHRALRIIAPKPAQIKSRRMRHGRPDLGWPRPSGPIESRRTS